MRTHDLFISASAENGGATLTGTEAQVIQIDRAGLSSRVWLGHDGDGRAVAYFETPTPGIESFAISRAITVDSVIVQEISSTDPITTAKILCHDLRLTDVFYGFIDEILPRIDKSSPIETIRSVASEWRSLLQVATSSLSQSAAAGIFGELKFLEELTKHTGSRSLELWQRSGFDVHDFIGDSARVEVKTSSFQNHSSVTIHGLRQLEPPDNASLTLAVAEIQLVGDESLNDVAGRILDSGVDSTLFTQKLAEAGYVIGMPAANDFSFSLLSWRFFEITSESPVLNHSALGPEISDGVSNLEFQMSLSALGDAATNFDFERLSKD